MVGAQLASKGLTAITGASSGQMNDILSKMISLVANVVKLAVIVFLAIFLFRNPPRPGGPHNFQRKNLGEVSNVFRGAIKQFVAFYGDRMDVWWSGLVNRATTDEAARKQLTDICDKWKERGKSSVFNRLFLENNVSTTTSGRITIDVRTDFYRYPGRTFDKDDDKDIILAAGSANLDIARSDPSARWPTISKKVADGARNVPIKPELDFQTWFDMEFFDPRQVVDESGSVGFMKKMRAVERHDLLSAALPAFVETLYAENSIFRHVRIEDIDGLVSHIRENGVSLDDPTKLPDFMIRYGVKMADAKCLEHAADKLVGASVCLEERLIARLHRAVSSNTVLARSIARHADPADLVNLEAMNAEKLASSILKISAEKNTALFYASRALNAWRDAKARSELTAAAMRTGSINTLQVKTFVREATPLFENAMTDFLACLRIAGVEENTDKNSLAVEYTAWHGAMDILRAVEDDTYEVTLKQLKNIQELITKSGLVSSSNCNVYRELYRQYANAVKCAVYIETYLDDAKMKWNVRYMNPLAADSFYKTYFSDIGKAYWTKYDYTSIPRRDCVDCFKPYVSSLGNIYNVESVAEYSVRYWQSKGGINKSIVANTRRKLSKALRSSLLSCEFSVAFVRKILGEEFDGKGFYGGMNNRVWIYKMSHPASKLVWSIQDGDWVDDGVSVSMPFVWDNVTHGDEVVVEDCVQGGSVIYSRYSSKNDGLNRFMSADEHGNLRTDNKILISSLNFSGCMHGLSRQPHVSGSGDVSEIVNMGDATELDGIFRKEIGRSEVAEADMKAGKTVEGFETEPNDTRTEEGDYCYAGDTEGTPDMSQAGLFHFIDITDPPDRMTLNSKRTCIVLSKSARDGDPRYANKRLLAFGYDSTTERNVPVLIDDTPENRGRAMITLETMSLNTTGGAVIGFPDVNSNGVYDQFLDQGGDRANVDAPTNMNSLWILIGVLLASALVTALTLGAAGPVVATFFVGHLVSVTTAAVITATTGAALLISGSMIADQQLRARAMGVALETESLIHNKLTGTQLNPFIDEKFRYMLVLEKPGIWPEFSIVPYTTPSQTIGSDPPTPEDSSPDARIVPRDYQSGASRVILIQAKDKNKNSVNMVYAPIITEHRNDNFSRVGMPFYIYSPHKRMFLTPPVTGKPEWVNADSDPSTAPQIVSYGGGSIVLEADGNLLTVELRTKSNSGNQRFRRVYDSSVDASVSPLDKLNMPFKLQVDTVGVDAASGMFVTADADGSVSLKIDQYASEWTFDGRRLISTVGGRSVALEAVGNNVNRDLKLGNRDVHTGSSQVFDLNSAECSGGISYLDADIIAGKMPGAACVRPFYVYEMLPTDYTNTQRDAMNI